MLGLIRRDLQFEIAETVANETPRPRSRSPPGSSKRASILRIVCRELARLVRDLLVIRSTGTRQRSAVASEGEADRLKTLSARYSREDLLRAFDLLARAEGEIRYSSQPRHHFEMR